MKLGTKLHTIFGTHCKEFLVPDTICLTSQWTCRCLIGESSFFSDSNVNLGPVIFITELFSNAISAYYVLHLCNMSDSQHVQGEAHPDSWSGQKCLTLCVGMQVWVHSCQLSVTVVRFICSSSCSQLTCRCRTTRIRTSQKLSTQN